MAEDNLLRNLRSSRGLSQQEASKKAKISRQTWAAWEAKTRPITLDQLEQIKKALQLTVDEVLHLMDWWKQHADPGRAKKANADPAPEVALSES